VERRRGGEEERRRGGEEKRTRKDKEILQQIRLYCFDVDCGFVPTKQSENHVRKKVFKKFCKVDEIFFGQFNKLFFVFLNWQQAKEKGVLWALQFLKIQF